MARWLTTSRSARARTSCTSATLPLRPRQRRWPSDASSRSWQSSDLRFDAELLLIRPSDLESPRPAQRGEGGAKRRVRGTGSFTLQSRRDSLRGLEDRASDRAPVPRESRAPSPERTHDRQAPGRDARSARRARSSRPARESIATRRKLRAPAAVRDRATVRRAEGGGAEP